MNEWQVAAMVLGFLLVATVPIALLASPAHGLVALEVASVLTTTMLMLLAEGAHRESFIDLAVVFAVMSSIGAFAFARLMERDL